jgi:hypothetical protein
MEILLLPLLALFWLGMEQAIRHVNARIAAEADPFAPLQKPATEELRQIYREIDTDCGIIEPELLTPEKPITLDDCLSDEVSDQVVQAWANILYSYGRDLRLREAEWPRVEVKVHKKGNDYSLVFPENIRFPKWNQAAALAVFAFYSGPDKEKDKQHVAVLDNLKAKAVNRGDELILNSITTSKERLH